MASVSTYLNFPNNTEEAFNFYKIVFNSEFAPGGIRRFSDMPPNEDQSPISDEVKNLVMHVELPITAGHILMGTDAPESLGFHVLTGNNVYISLHPDSRVETKRLFDALSAEGTVTMDLKVMFWGGYYGSCIDQFGIQWMFNCLTKE